MAEDRKPDGGVGTKTGGGDSSGGAVAPTTGSSLLVRLKALDAARAQSKKTILGVLPPEAAPAPQPVPMADPSMPLAPPPSAQIGSAADTLPAKNRAILPSPRPRVATLPPPGGLSASSPPLPPVRDAGARDSVPVLAPIPLSALAASAPRDESQTIPGAELLTAPRKLLDAAPMPLPPSPAAEDAEVWFDEAPTRPSALSDLTTLNPSDPQHRPRVANPARPLGQSGESSDSSESSAVPTRPDARGDESPRPASVSDTLIVDRDSSGVVMGDAQRDVRAWLLQALLLAAAVVVGLLLGALLFRRPPGAGDDKRSALPAVTAPCPEVRTAAEEAPAVVPEVASDATAGPTSAAAMAEGEAPGGAGAAATACVMRVESSPPGAEVAIDGVAVGKAPVDVGRPCGQSMLVGVSALRFQPWQKKVTPTTSGPKRLVASLARPRSRLAVISSPPGATVIVGSRVAGRTPTTVDVAAFARISVKVTLSGYKPFETTVTPKPGSPLQVKATLEKLGQTRKVAKPVAIPRKSATPPKVSPLPPPARKPRF